jgi:hypothetical protein
MAKNITLSDLTEVAQTSAADTQDYTFAYSGYAYDIKD